MVIRIFKKLLKNLFRLFIVLIVVIGINALIESRHSFMDYKQHIGVSAQSAFNEYSSDNRLTHIEYLKTFNYQNLNIRYIDRWPVDWTPLFLIHWTPTNSWLYRKMIPWLIAQGYRVIVPDMVWFGTSSMPKDRNSLSSEQQAKRINALARHIETESIVIASHDQWSLWAQEFLISYPQKVEAYIIFNWIYERSWFHPPQWFGTENIWTRIISWAMGSIPLWRVFAYGAMIWGIKNIRLATPTMVNWYLYPLLHWMNHSYYNFITSFSAVEQDLQRYQDERAKLTTLPPTLVVRWGHDKILVWKEQIPFIEKSFSVKQWDVHLLDDAAHFIQEEKAETIVTLIHNFLQ